MNKQNQRTKKLSKSMAYIFIIAFFVHYYLATVSTQLTPDNGKFVYENLASLLMFVMIGLVISLSAIQKQAYWIIRPNPQVKLDERELELRKRVFEKSYKIAMVASIISFLWLRTTVVRSDAILLNSTRFSSIAFSYLLLLFALPRLVAALQNDKK